MNYNEREKQFNACLIIVWIHINTRDTIKKDRKFAGTAELKHSTFKYLVNSLHG